ncbi:MAG: cytochrome C oxidase subunit IV family protein [Telluria sp.]
MKPRPLILTWLALLVLLALTAGSALLRLGAWNGIVNWAVAVAKALLVALVFMRLRRAPALLRVAALAGLATLVLLVLLSSTDYATRSLPPAPWQQPRTVQPRVAAADQPTSGPSTMRSAWLWTGSVSRQVAISLR